MSKLDQSRLLRFLHKPRFVHEVAEHFGISMKLANLHLREAIRSGKVLVSETPIFQGSKVSRNKLTRFDGFVYVFQDSVREEGERKFKIKGSNDPTSKTTHDFSFGLPFSTAHATQGKGESHKLSNFRFGETASPRNQPVHFKAKGSFASAFDLPSARVKVVKRTMPEYVLAHGSISTKEETRSLSNAERIRLLRTLLKPSTFLDLHGCFGVSKETIKSLVKNGLLAEMWGPKAVGLRFQLTKKGKAYLKKLEASARIKPGKRETSFVKLKSRVSI